MADNFDERFKYQMVSNGSMNEQINVRLPMTLLKSARSYSNKHGYSTVQEFIKETLRERLFGPELSAREMLLVKQLARLSEANKLYGTETELFKKLK